MKRLILFFALAVLMTGCAGYVFRSPSDIANKVWIGMSMAEFKKLAGQHAELDAMTANHTVYRVEQWAGPEEDRYISSVKFYHFNSEQRLVEVETRDLPHPFVPVPHPIFEPLIP